ncbi:hypothetical protein QOZ80_5BG0429200 [Eleusine coracana subsp. coracana]|nr:hypothetical protein QOZ80_5BG0429200 [Eleusine coracana subsp. coracana]
MEGRRALWLALLASTIVAASVINGNAAMADGGAGQPSTPAAGGSGPDTNMLCVSKCGTCPTVCSSSPPPPSSSSSEGGIVQPGTPSGGGGGYGSSSSPSPPSSSRSTSPPAGQQGKGDGHPSNYYYFFTAGSGRQSRPSGYALVSFMVLASLAAGFQ